MSEIVEYAGLEIEVTPDGEMYLESSDPHEEDLTEEEEVKLFEKVVDEEYNDIMGAVVDGIRNGRRTAGCDAYHELRGEGLL